MWRPGRMVATPLSNPLGQIQHSAKKMADFWCAVLLSLVEEALWSKFPGLQTPSTTRLLRFASCLAPQYLLIKAYRHILHPHFLSPLRHLPGPTDNVPLLGQFPRILTSPSPNEPYLTWSEKWPSSPFIRYLGLGNQETLLINTVAAHKEVLQTHCYAFKKPDLLFRLIGDFLGRGLLFSEGAAHRRQRRILLGLFSAPNLKRISPVFRDKGDLMAQWFDDNLDADGRGVFDGACIRHGGVTWADESTSQCWRAMPGWSSTLSA